MVEKQQIIIGYYRQGKSQRSISRETGLSRRTVKKYIQQYADELKQSNLLVKDGVISRPKYDSSTRKSRRLSDEMKLLIRTCLSKNRDKQNKGMSKQQMKATDIHEYLESKGHTIGYTTVCNFIRQENQKGSEIFIRQDHRPGQAVEFDWGEVKLVIDGKLKRIQLAIFTSSYSNYRWACLFYRQDMASFLQSHVLFFNHLQYVPQQMIYDNMRVAVKKFGIKNSDKVATDDLLKLSSYYQFDYRFCNIRRGNEKGHVEKSVEFVRRKSFSRHCEFASLQAANLHLSQTCERLNTLTIKGSEGNIKTNMLEELKCMKPAVANYDVGTYMQLRVDKYHCIKVDTNSYSVPEGYIYPFIEVKLYPSQILIYDRQHNCIAKHERRLTKYQYYIELNHYIHVFRKKPGALNRSAALRQSTEWLQELHDKYFKERAIAFIDLLTFFKQCPYTENQLRQVIENCIRLSPNSPITVDKVRIVAKSIFDPKTPHVETNTATNQPHGFTQQIQEHCLDQLRQAQQFFNQ